MQGVFAVLAELGRVDGLGLSGLAERTGLPKATVHRLLEQLIDESAVERFDGRYRLGPSMFQFGLWQPARELRAAAKEPIRELVAAAPGLTVNLGVPYGVETILAGVVPGETAEVLPTRLGDRLPHDTEAGVLWAAYAPDGDPPPGVPVAEWRRRVRRMRACQGAITSTKVECAPEVSAVSAPVFDSGGAVVGAISLLTLDERKLAKLAAPVSRAARLISGNLARVGRAVRAEPLTAGRAAILDRMDSGRQRRLTALGKQGVG